MRLQYQRVGWEELGAGIDNRFRSDDMNENCRWKTVKGREV